MLNDEKILLLKKQIEEKENQVNKAKKTKKFTPVTNCMLNLDGQQFNLQVLNPEQLTLLLVKLNSYLLSVKDLELKGFEFSGFSLEDWIFDIKSKLELINLRQEENNLKAMKQKLEKLLSEEKKTELEIQAIEEAFQNLQI